MLAIPILRRLRQKDLQFKASLSYIARPHLKNCYYHHHQQQQAKSKRKFRCPKVTASW
jgi:hypothetical protein